MTKTYKIAVAMLDVGYSYTRVYLSVCLCICVLTTPVITAKTD